MRETLSWMIDSLKDVSLKGWTVKIFRGDFVKIFSCKYICIELKNLAHDFSRKKKFAHFHWAKIRLHVVRQKNIMHAHILGLGKYC